MLTELLKEINSVPYSLEVYFNWKNASSNQIGQMTHNDSKILVSKVEKLLFTRIEFWKLNVQSNIIKYCSDWIHLFYQCINTVIKFDI